MTFEEVYHAVIQTLIDVTGVEHVAAEMPMAKGGLDLDDLDQVQLVMAVEQRLNIQIDEHEFETPLALVKAAHREAPKKYTPEEANKTLAPRFHFDYMPPAKE